MDGVYILFKQLQIKPAFLGNLAPRAAECRDKLTAHVSNSKAQSTLPDFKLRTDILYRLGT